MTRTLARSHARRLVAAIPADQRQALSEDPLVALEALGFALRLRAELEITGACSVAGSFQPGPPPTITVVETRSRGRRYFTALHEYGHRLIAADHDIHDVFLAEDDDGARLEEDVCDAVAAELLLPDTMVDAHIGPAGPSAQSVIDLFHASHASREACCVRAAQRIAGPGHVMLAVDGVAQFTATTGSPFRVRRATPQGPDHLVSKAARLGSSRGEASLRYASGATSDRFFADATADDDGYVFAVLMEGRPPWLTGLTLLTGDRVEATHTVCGHCDVGFETLAAPCSTCGDYRHTPDGCGRCSCGPVTEEQLCRRCFLRRPPAEFTQGQDVCDICLEG